MHRRIYAAPISLLARFSRIDLAGIDVKMVKDIGWVGKTLDGVRDGL
jgi:hypothetical protein